MARKHSRESRGAQRETDVSRRDFFKTVGAGSVAAAMVSTGAEAEAQAAAIGPGEVPITLTINGQRHRSGSSRASRCSTRCGRGSTSPA